MKVNKTDAMEIATLGGGCYWCLEAVFELLDGVCSVQSGASGGHTENPTYEELCSGKTGHVEVVQLKFDPCLITFGDILEIFFSIHDPTTVNRQGGDVGTQYRSAIFFHSPEQQQAAESSRTAAQERINRPIATEITGASTFYRAEEYHQQYLEKRGLGSCHL